MKVLFLSTPPPDEAKLFVGGHPSAADLACRGIAQGLFKRLGKDFIAVGYQITKVFPRSRQLVIWPHKLRDVSGMAIRMMPAINIAFLREVCESATSFLFVIFWSLANWREKRIVVTYNLAHPPFEAVLFACKLVRAKYIPVLHDMGLVLYGGGSLVRRTYYRWAENRIVKLLPCVSGAAVICDAIKEKYLPRNKTMLLDGGITDEVVAKLFPLERNSDNGGKTVFVMAGGMSDYNGVTLLLRAMAINRNQAVELRFAGAGSKVADIEAAAKRDSRIVYLGSLSHAELFEHYKEADCILNIRITGEIDTSLYFPSKFLEALATGRLVLSTCTGHLEQDYGAYCELLKDETAEALSGAFDQIASMGRKKRDEKGAIGRWFMLENRTWDKQSGRLLAFLKEVA